MLNPKSSPAIIRSHKFTRKNSKVVELTTVGSFEEATKWRQPYLDWLSQSILHDQYSVQLKNYSRTWYLIFTFKDTRDAIWFKLTKVGNF